MRLAKDQGNQRGSTHEFEGQSGISGGRGLVQYGNDKAKGHGSRAIHCCTSTQFRHFLLYHYRLSLPKRLI